MFSDNTLRERILAHLPRLLETVGQMEQRDVMRTTKFGEIRGAEDEWEIVSENETAAGVVDVCLDEEDLAFMFESYLDRAWLSEDGFKDLRSLVFGRRVPQKMRPLIWKAFLCREFKDDLERKRCWYDEKVTEYEEKYDDMMQRNIVDPTFVQILMDIPRTSADGCGGVARNEWCQHILGRVGFIWSYEHPDVAYFQGFLDLVFVFLCCFITRYGDEPDSVLSLANVTLDHITKDDWLDIEFDVYVCVESMMNMQCKFLGEGSYDGFLLEEVQAIKEVLIATESDVWKDEEMTSLIIPLTYRWMICFLAREFKPYTQFRIWDLFFALVDFFPLFHVFFCAAILLIFEDDFRNKSQVDRILFIQHLPLWDWATFKIEYAKQLAVALARRVDAVIDY